MRKDSPALQIIDESGAMGGRPVEPLRKVDMAFRHVSLAIAMLAIGACNSGAAKDAAPEKAPISHFAEAEFAANTGGDLKASPFFTRHELGEGISIELPNDWYVLDRGVVGKIVEQGAITLDVAGMPDGSPQTRNLIKANSSKRDPGAILSVNVDIPPSIAPSDFNNLTVSDLTDARDELRGEFEKAARAGGLSITKFYGAHLDTFGPYPALVIEYERAGLLKAGDFVVQINQIAMGDKTIKLTMSYRVADAVIWKARMARVRKSLVLR
jgi:hypothetical protein